MIHPAVLVPENTSFPLNDSGYIWHNDPFTREKYVVHPVDGGVIPAKSLLKKFPQLESLTRNCLVPPFFAYHMAKKETVEAVRITRRSVMTDDEYVLDLKKLGFSDEPEHQAFRKVVKGCGVQLCESDFVYEDGLLNLAKRHGFYKNARKLTHAQLQKTSLINRGDHEFEAPEGGELKEDICKIVTDANNVIRGWYGLKITPVVAGVPLPRETQVYAKELANSLPNNSPLYEEILLFPSNLRVQYFESQPQDKLHNLVALVSDDPSQLRKTRKQIMRDAARFLEVISRTTREYTDNSWGWACLFDIWLAYGARGRVLDRPMGWFTAKDLVVAQTGVYFTDFEAWDSCEYGTESEIQDHQYLHVVNTLKVFSRFLTLFSTGIEQLEGRSLNNRQKKELERDTLDEMLGVFNESGYLTIEPRANSINVYIDCKNVDYRTFKIDRKYLFPFAETNTTV